MHENWLVQRTSCFFALQVILSTLQIGLFAEIVVEVFGLFGLFGLFALFGLRGVFGLYAVSWTMSSSSSTSSRPGLVLFSGF